LTDVNESQGKNDDPGGRNESKREQIDKRLIFQRRLCVRRPSGAEYRTAP
jgi:hypothetical protein